MSTSSANPLLRLWRYLHRFTSPPVFERWARRLSPWFYGIALLLMVVGIYWALVKVPADYLQGESYRILFIHVPSAWMSMFVYVAMAVSAFFAVVWRTKLAEWMVISAAPIGAGFTAITLASGSIWGRPTWGVWWTWDARLTSELVLLFVYLGIMGLYAAFEDRRQGARAASFMTLVGLVNLPIIHYSVVWANTLHQGATIKLVGKSTMDESMIMPLVLMTIATKLWFVASWFARSRQTMLNAEIDKSWAQPFLASKEQQP